MMAEVAKPQPLGLEQVAGHEEDLVDLVDRWKRMPTVRIWSASTNTIESHEMHEIAP